MPPDAVDGFLRGKRVLPCDRDTKFTQQFRKAIEAAGTRVVLTPCRVPNRNLHAERNHHGLGDERLGGLLKYSRRAA